MKFAFAATHSIVVAMALSSAAAAASYEVQMRNQDSSGRAWQFEPAFLKIAPGDTVTFVPADKGHNSETLAQAVPAGATPWKGGFNEAVTITYTQEGLYVYKCLPHAPLGMVGVIQVGDTPSAIDGANIEGLPGKAAERVAELLSQAQ